MASPANVTGPNAAAHRRILPPRGQRGLQAAQQAAGGRSEWHNSGARRAGISSYSSGGGGSRRWRPCKWRAAICTQTQAVSFTAHAELPVCHSAHMRAQKVGCKLPLCRPSGGGSAAAGAEAGSCAGAGAAVQSQQQPHQQQQQQRQLTQLYLDVGQRHFHSYRCPACGMLYARGTEAGEQAGTAALAGGAAARVGTHMQMFRACRALAAGSGSTQRCWATACHTCLRLSARSDWSGSFLCSARAAPDPQQACHARASHSCLLQLTRAFQHGSAPSGPLACCVPQHNPPPRCCRRAPACRLPCQRPGGAPLPGLAGREGCAAGRQPRPRAALQQR